MWNGIFCPQITISTEPLFPSFKVASLTIKFRKVPTKDFAMTTRVQYYPNSSSISTFCASRFGFLGNHFTINGQIARISGLSQHLSGHFNGYPIRHSSTPAALLGGDVCYAEAYADLSQTLKNLCLTGFLRHL
jgi:hypothetical protein